MKFSAVLSLLTPFIPLNKASLMLKKQEGAVIKAIKIICFYASLPLKAFCVCALQFFCGVSFSGYPFLILLFSIY
jgi:hypothetical protein